MKSRPLITVAIAVYNTEKYLKDCMESVVNQTYRNLEIICVNDASTDSSLVMLESYASRDARIKIITNEKNSGLGVTRNVGMDAAHGEYILFIDSDDWLDLTACEKLLNKAKEDDAEIVFYSAYQVEGDRKKVMNNSCDVSFPLTFEDRKLLLLKTFHSTWSKLWNRNFMIQHEIRFPNFRRAQDQKPHWMGCIFADRICFLNESLYFYRSNPYQIGKCSDERLLVIADVYQDIENLLAKEKVINDFRDVFLFNKITSISSDYISMNNTTRKKFKKIFKLNKYEKKYLIFKMKSIKGRIISLSLISNIFLFIFTFYKKHIKS
ncbi:MAG: glycosyltransferase family 2 protein [Candidatus Margulisbacteria bacterium]|nr:glycosyltransferase family 2 protein [Candidatus Margulisiibacteriota bacterium]